MLFSRPGPGGMNPNMGPGGPMSMPNPGMNNMNMSSMSGMSPMPPHMAGGPANPNAHPMGMNSPNMPANGGSPLGNNPINQHLSNSPIMGPPMHSPSTMGNGPMSAGSRINVPNGSPLNANAPPTSMANVPPMGMGNVPGGGGGSCNGPPNLSHHPQNDQMNNALGGGPAALAHMPQQSPHGNLPTGPPVSGGNNAPDNTNLISNNVDMMGMNHPTNHHMNSMNAMNGPPLNHQLNRMYGGPGPGGPGPGPGPKPMPLGAGKIYPPNQPMVFNPQNPSAPPIYTCGSCHKEINDNDEEALFCESGCNFFFHRYVYSIYNECAPRFTIVISYLFRPCTGLTESAFQMIKKEVYVEWVCDNCLKLKDVPPVKFKC